MLTWKEILEMMQCADEAMIKQIEQKLRMNDAAFTVETAKPFQYGRDLMDVDLNFSRKKGLLSLECVWVALKPSPIIRDGVFEGINTGQLDRQMELINWNKDFTNRALFKDNMSLGDLLENTDAISIYRAVRRLLLSPDPAAVGIGYQLQKKHWMGKNFGASFGLPAALDAVVPAQNFTFDIQEGIFTLEQMYHLVSGRAINGQNVAPSFNHHAWFQIDFNDAFSLAGGKLRKLAGFDLDKALDKLIFPELGDSRRAEAVSVMKAGRPYPVKLPQAQRDIQLMADPIGGSIRAINNNLLPFDLTAFLKPGPELHKRASQRLIRVSRHGKSNRP